MRRTFMINRLNYWRFAGVIYCALLASPAYAFISDDRWTATATNASTGAGGTPITLTWSFPPNGASVGGVNDLLSFLDANWGVGPGGGDLTQRPWFPIFQQSYDRIAELSGVTFVYEPHDNGVPFSNSASGRGVLGTRGDVRLGGYPLPSSSNVLARNYFPNYGEMMINTNQAAFFKITANGYRAFRNTLMHETMHGLGVSHVESSDARILIEPFISTAFDGPQLDDVLAIQRLYGDAYEKKGGNDAVGNAMPLGAVTPSQPRVMGSLGDSKDVGPDQSDFMSIDDDSDVDYFSFTLGATLDVDLTLTPKGASYLVGPENGVEALFDARVQSNLALSLFTANGTTLLGSSDAAGPGGNESISQQLAAGTYFARVTGAQDKIQLYELAINATAIPSLEFAAADFNLDGQVDGDDLAMWSSGSLSQSTGDANDDQVVDGTDFLAWQRQVTPPGGTGSMGSPVPESTGAMLSLAATLAYLAYGRAALSER